MKAREFSKAIGTGVIVIVLIAAVAGPRAAEEQTEAAPQNVAFPGEFVRLGFNDEGHVVLGYRIANESVGEEWMLLEKGMTLNRGVEPLTITRDAIYLETPDGTKVPLATQEEFGKAAGSLRGLDKRATIARDRLNYLPKSAPRACTLSFFSDISGSVRKLAYDQFQLGSDSQCYGRIYFRLPDGIQYGQHVFNVRLRDTTVGVPFRIMTKQELKEVKAEVRRMEKEAKKAAKQGK